MQQPLNKALVEYWKLFKQGVEKYADEKENIYQSKLSIEMSLLKLETFMHWLETGEIKS